ncbi:cholesterol 25-hydroxylase-like protein [Chanos chanos]|uniref:Cholesterol 25-hydroxylase-like protein n=1 Tax=Chanos chanos TaxID=29144 RepID=A0A6J2WTT9_CHACN|nr:cholesterol 25-hydroxylase-like protein [Chanos chanos]
MNLTFVSLDEFLIPLWTVSLSLLVHLIFSLLFLVLDLFGSNFSCISQYRMPGEVVTFHRWMNCLGRIFRRYIFGVLPLMMLLHRVRNVSIPYDAPSLARALWEVFLCLLMFDTLFFWWHYCMHRFPWLYRQVHRAHHLHRDTFALAAQDLSISELMSLQLLAILSAWWVNCHPLSEILFHLLNLWLAVEDHCGYDFPWALHNILPCFGGAPFHQAHHRYSKGNYAPYFKHWDWICGTTTTKTNAHRKER